MLKIILPSTKWKLDTDTAFLLIEFCVDEMNASLNELGAGYELYTRITYTTYKLRTYGKLPKPS